MESQDSGFGALRGAMPPAMPNILASAMPSPPSDVRGGSMQAAALQPSLPPVAQPAPQAPAAYGGGGDSVTTMPHDLALHNPHIFSPPDVGHGQTMQADAGSMMPQPGGNGAMAGLQQLRRPMAGPRGMPQL